MPSRQSFFTGLYPNAIGCMDNGIELPEDQLIFPTLLKQAGYTTANIGKLHFKNHSNRDHRDPHPSYGFDELLLSDEPGCYDDAYIAWVTSKDASQVEKVRCGTPPICETEFIIDKPREVHEPYVFEGDEALTHSAFVAEKSVEFITRHQERPFCLISGFYAPHTPINPPERFVQWYQKASIPKPVMLEGEDQFNLSEEQWLTIKKYYYALISHVDDQVGRILSKLDELGLSDITLVFFTSDHGEHLGDHGRIQKGPPGLDSCVRVPLLMRWPAKFKPQRRFEMAELVDVSATILDCANVQVPRFFQGRSLKKLVEQDIPWRASAFTEFRTPYGQSWKSLRTDQARLCVSNDGEVLLFDHKSDPHELYNIAEQPKYRDLRLAMMEELTQRTFESERQLPTKTGAY
jgi:arylsulfatase A-like enzyme